MEQQEYDVNTEKIPSTTFSTRTMEAHDVDVWSNDTSNAPFHNGAPIQFKKGTELSEEIHEELLHLCNNPHTIWSSLPSSDSTVTVSKTLNLSTNLEVYRAEGIIDAPAAVIFDILFHSEDQQDWDEFCIESKIVEEFDTYNNVFYSSLALSVPTAPRDLCTYRCASVSTDGQEYVIAQRSVQHKKVPLREGYIRMQIYPSGYIIKSLGYGKTKLIILMQADMGFDSPNDLFEDNPFNCGTLVARVIPTLKNYMIQGSTDTQKQYLARIVIRTYKEICDVFMCNDAMASGWKKVLKMQSYVDIWCKHLPEKDVMCTAGVFKLDVPPKIVFETLVDLQNGNPDPLAVSSSLVEDIDGHTKIWNICWKSVVDPCLVDSILLQSRRVSSDGVYMIVSRSVVHNKAPASFAALEKVFVIRTMANINTLRTKLLNSFSSRNDTSSMEVSNDSQPLNSQSRSNSPTFSVNDNNNPTNHNKLEVVSKLCSVLVNQHEEKEKLVMQLNRPAENSRKRKLAEYSLITLADDKSDNNSADALPSLDKILSTSTANLIGSYSKKPFNFVVTRAKEKQLYVNAASYFEMLPNEILLNIMSYFDEADLCRFAQVIKRFKFLAEEETLWKRLVKTKWQTSDESQMEYDWKHTFKNKYLIHSNWSKGRYKKKILEGHMKSIRGIRYDENYIVSGSSDKIVKVWHPQTGNCLQTFSGPTSGVIALAYDGNRVTAGFSNGAMRSWDIDTGKCVWDRQFNYFSDGFLFVDSKVVSWDQSIQIWDATTGRILLTLNEHTKKINCVELCGNMMVSGSTDKTVKRYDLRTGKSTHTFSGHSASINAVDIDPNFVVSGGNDKIVNLWDLRKATDTNVSLKGHVCPVKCVKLSTTMVVSGGADNTLRAWHKNMMSESCIQKFEEHNAPVTALQFDEKRIVSGANDGLIVLWDFTHH